MAQHSLRQTRRFPHLALLVAASFLLAACATGPRPSFDDEGDQSTAPLVSTGDAQIDTVLALLDSVDDAEFTAEYAIDTKYNTVSSTGLVVQATGRRRSITVSNADRQVRFLVDGTDERTCDLLTASCEPSLNDARISDTQLPHTFYAPAFARRLRADAQRTIDAPKLYDKAIAGQNATCVDLIVSGGTKIYCALASGLLAEFVGADVVIELTSYSPEPDTSTFDAF